MSELRPADGASTGEDLAGEAPAPSRKKAILAIGVAVVVGLVVFGWILPQLVDWKLVGEAIRSVDAIDVAILVVLAVIRYWPAGWIYSLVLPGLTVNQGTQAWVATTGVSSTLPGFDLVLRLAMYSSWGHSIERSTSGMFLSGLVEMSTKIVLAITAVTLWALVAADLPLLAVGAIAALVVVIAGILVALVLRSEAWARRAGHRIDRLLRWAFAKVGRQAPDDIVDRVLAVRLEARHVLGRRWPLAFLAAFLGQALVYVMLTHSLRMVGVGSNLLDWSEILLVQGLAILITTIPITPGSVGIAELVYIGFFGALTDGEGSDLIAAGVILFRLAVWLLPIPIGWAVTLRWQAKSGQRLFGAGGRPLAGVAT